MNKKKRSTRPKLFSIGCLMFIIVGIWQCISGLIQGTPGAWSWLIFSGASVLMLFMPKIFKFLTLRFVNAPMRFVGVSITIGGLIFAIIGFSLLLSEIQFKKDAIAVTGTITRIETNTDYRETTHDVYVTYEITDQTYRDIPINNWNSGMHEGDSLKLYYNPNNPNNIMASNSIVIIVFCGFGTVFTTVGTILLIKHFRNRVHDSGLTAASTR